MRARIFHELGQLEFGCEVLGFGFTRRMSQDLGLVIEPQIIEADRYGEVLLHDNFGAVGTGSVVAKTNLYMRQQSAWIPLEDTLYNLVIIPLIYNPS